MHLGSDARESDGKILPTIKINKTNTNIGNTTNPILVVLRRSCERTNDGEKHNWDLRITYNYVILAL